MKPKIKGHIGVKLGCGEVAYNSYGFETTPFPKIDLTNNRKAINTLKRIDEWLISNALLFAQSRNDKYMVLQFEQISKNMRNISQSDKDCAEYYLFS